MSAEEDACSQEIERAVTDVIQNIMILDYSKKPIKKSDIVSSSLDKKPPRNYHNKIFDKAKKYLNDLGLELVDVTGSSTKSFFVVSKNRPLRMMYKYATDEEKSDRILLTLVLAYILMKNGLVSSDELLNHLKDLKICNDSELPHPYFGNVKRKVFTDFVDQLYLSSRRISDSGLCEISWGQRAGAEVTKKSILEFVCKCGFDGKIEPKNLKYHYDNIEQQESQSEFQNKEESAGCTNRSGSPILFSRKRKSR